MGTPCRPSHEAPRRPASGRGGARRRAAEEEHEGERQKLIDEWPTMQGREKGEAMRRFFKTVTLFWERKHHAPLARTDKRERRKTERKGRNSFTLLRDKVQ